MAGLVTAGPLAWAQRTTSAESPSPLSVTAPAALPAATGAPLNLLPTSAVAAGPAKPADVTADKPARNAAPENPPKPRPTAGFVAPSDERPTVATAAPAATPTPSVTPQSAPPSVASLPAATPPDVVAPPPAKALAAPQETSKPQPDMSIAGLKQGDANRVQPEIVKPPPAPAAPAATTALQPDDAATPKAPPAAGSEQPGAGKVTVIVAGDSIADGIWGGLYRKLIRDKRYEIVRKAKNSSGFVAFDWIEELAGSEEIKRADAVVFLVGANDRQSLVMPGRARPLFASKDWETNYVERVTAFMASVRGRNIPLVWVGLPIARKDEFNKDSRYLNTIYAEAARKTGALYVDIWPLFTDRHGEYSAYLPDAQGRNVLLRDNDGIHFTPRGYEMIADLVLDRLQQSVPAFQAIADKPEGAKAASAAPLPKKVR